MRRLLLGLLLAFLVGSVGTAALAQTSTPTQTPTVTLTATPTTTPTPTPTVTATFLAPGPAKRFGAAAIALLPAASAVNTPVPVAMGGYARAVAQVTVSTPCSSFSLTSAALTTSDVAAGSSKLYALTMPVGFLRARLSAISSCTVAVDVQAN